MSVSSASQDLASKYQRLASEYAKLRAQVPVLKEAVVSEKAGKAAAEAAAEAAGLERRKREAEAEALAFRNEQLRRRVAVLQDAADAQAKGPKPRKGSRSHNDPAPNDYLGPSTALLQQELQAKLQENERLHSRLAELEGLGEAAQRLASLEDRNRQLAEEAAAHKAQATAQLRDADARAERLRWELEEERKRTRDVPATTPKPTTAGPNDEAGAAQAEAALLSQPQDRAEAASGPSPAAVQAALPALLPKTGVAALGKALAGFFTYSAQRLKQLELNDSQSLADALSEGARLTKAFTEELAKATDEASPELDAEPLVSAAESLCGLWAETLAEELCRGLDLESGLGWSTAELRSLNQAYARGLRAHAQLLRGLDADRDVTAFLAKLSESFRTLWKDFEAKMLAEKGLDEVPKRLRTTSECLLAALSAAQRQTKALADAFAGHKDVAAHLLSQRKPKPLLASTPEPQNPFSDEEAKPSPPEENGNPFVEEDASNPFGEEEEPASDPFEPNEETRDSGNPFEDEPVAAEVPRVEPPAPPKDSAGVPQPSEELKAELDDLKAQVAHFQARVQALESEREALSLRVQVDAHKAGRAVEGGEETEDEAQALQDHFRQRLDRLTADLVRAEAAQVFFRGECERLVRSTRVALAGKAGTEEELAGAREEVAQLHDDLATTRHGYEAQLASLSEHLAGLTASLSAAEAEAVALRAGGQGGTAKDHSRPRKLRDRLSRRTNDSH